ncbi:MAG: hypothetical protein IH600_11560 [Bacteroidetes bacterium]|nr:hypothetical protein [Bacteroidota bacterium]
MFSHRALAQDAEITCELSGPDSIRFVETMFVPDQFFLEVALHNRGDADVANVTVYILQGSRFTLLSPQSRSVDTIAAGATVELRQDEGFLLQVKGGQYGGYDTLQLLVVGPGIRASCSLPVFVEAETEPRLELYCEPPGPVIFDSLLNDYIPNPFPVRTTLRNTGDGAANSCVLSYVGSSRIAPENGERSVAVGRLEPGEEYVFVWQMRPERRDNGGSEQMSFQAEGFGGMGNRFVSTGCETSAYIPAARAADYVCTLDIDAVRYDATSMRYTPDPFTVRARVTNIGQGIALGMTMRIILDDALVLAPGQSFTDTLPGALYPGETSGVYLKSLRPLWRENGDSLRIVVLFADRFGNATTCEAYVWIPPADQPLIELQCRSEIDTLRVDPSQGGYENALFLFEAGIRNLSPVPMFNVSLFALADPDGVLIIDPKSQEKPISSALLDSDGTRSVSWSVQALPSNTDRVVRLRVFSFARTASGHYLPLMTCEVPVFVPRAGQAQLQCTISTGVTDGNRDMTVAFDTARIDYEGIPSAFGNHTVFRSTVEIVNTGDAAAPFVTATLLLPAGLRFEEGEPPTKTVMPPRLAVGERGSASWLLRPMPVKYDSVNSIEALASAEQVHPSKCEMRLTVAEALDVVEISMPSHLTGVTGGVLEVPVSIGPTPDNVPGAYQLLIRYDPGLLRFVEARTEGSITAHSWRNLHTRIYSEFPPSGMNILVVADSTNSTPREGNAGGLLVSLFFEVTHQGSRLDDPGYVVQSPLEFVRYPSWMEDGMRLVPFVHPFDEAAKLTAIWRDGKATLSGDCLLPLSASTRLFPNQPNPFNPATTIPYYLAEETSFRIVLLDAFGRTVRLIEEGRRPRGQYSVLLDAGGLPSGIYFCRLETPHRTQLRKLLLTK